MRCGPGADAPASPLDGRQSGAPAGAYAGNMVWTRFFVDAGLSVSLLGVIGLGLYIFVRYVTG